MKNHLNLQPSDYKFISIDNKSLTKAGDNYSSLMVRSIVEIGRLDGKIETHSYVTKALVHNEYNKAYIDLCDAFPKEQIVYSKLIPAFEKLFADVGIEVQLAPKCFFIANDPTPLLVLEDLSHFVMIDKSLLLDRNHVERVLEKLAKFHAASMVHKELNGDYDETFKLGFNAMRVAPTFTPFIEAHLSFYIEALRKLPNGEKYIEKVKSWGGDFFPKMCASLAFDENSFNVLNHGDMWSNNFLFHYNSNGIVDDIKMLDYQMAFWGTVAQDLFMFMASSWNLDIKVKKFDVLIKFYFDELIGSLKVLSYKKTLPTFEQLERELRKRMFNCKFGAFRDFISFNFDVSSVSLITMTLLPFPHTKKPVSDPGYLPEYFNKPAVEDALMEIIPWLDQHGAMDLPKDEDN